MQNSDAQYFVENAALQIASFAIENIYPPLNQSEQTLLPFLKLRQVMRST